MFGEQVVDEPLRLIRQEKVCDTEGAPDGEATARAKEREEREISI